jgi:hypothetical protein
MGPWQGFSRIAPAIGNRSTLSMIPSPNLSDDSSRPDEDRPADLPPFQTIGSEWAPEAPTDPRDAGVSPAVLRDLALKAAYTVPQFTTEWVARELCLTQVLTAELKAVAL